MKPEWPIKLLAVLGIVFLLIGLLGILHDNVELFEDGSITLFDIQVACLHDWPCDDEVGTDVRYGYPDDALR